MRSAAEEEHRLQVVSVRLVDEPPLYSERPVQSPWDAVAVVQEEIAHYDRETGCILNLQTDGRVINLNIASIGTLNQALTVPRDLLKSTILSNAASIIFLHNHPSGNCHPSDADRRVTQLLFECGKLLGISLLDSIIVGPRGGYYSFREEGILPTAETAEKAAEREVTEEGRCR